MKKIQQYSKRGVNQTNKSPGEKNEFTSYLRAISISLGIGFFVSFLFLIVFSLILNIKDYPHSFIDPLAIISVGFGGFSCGFSCGKIIRKKGLFFGMICGLIFSSVLLISGVAFLSEEFSYIAVVKFAVCLILSMMGGIIGVNKKHK